MSFLIVFLVGNSSHISRGLQDFVVFKVIEKEIQAASPEYKFHAKPKNQLHHCMLRGKQKTSAIASHK